MHHLQYIHWDPDPSIFGLPFRWYGLLFASAFFFGYIIVNRIFQREHAPGTWMESLTIYMAVSTVAGARLGHCLFYDPGYYLSHPLAILRVWEGGLASHGAAIGIIAGLYLWSRRVSKRSLLWILDRIVIVVALSGLTIRTGNLMNSEILGKETTAAHGFVFPREDQDDALRARWEGGQVTLDFRPEASDEARKFEFYRSLDEKTYQRLPVPAVTIPAGKQGNRRAVQFRDDAPGTRGHVFYYSAEASGKPPVTVSNGDSLHPRIASFEDPFPAGQMALGGRWEGSRVHLRFDMRGMRMPGGTTRGTLLLRGNGDGHWTLIHSGVLGGRPHQMALDTLDDPAGIDHPHYRLVVKEDQSKLMARHPAQIYEAVTYTLIFLLLWGYYHRLKGRVPLGRLFGIFLVLVFGMRILIEFLKEEQAEYAHASLLTVGQWLSIPFVLLGVYFAVRSWVRPTFPPPLQNPAPASPAGKPSPVK